MSTMITRGYIPLKHQLTDREKYILYSWFIEYEIQPNESLNFVTMKRDLHHKIKNTSYVRIKPHLIEEGFISDKIFTYQWTGHDVMRDYCNTYEIELKAINTQRNLNESQVRINNILEHDLKYKFGWIIVSAVVSGIIAYIVSVNT